MPQSVKVEIEVPAELYHSLEGHINTLNKEEHTRLQSAPYPHGATSQWLLEHAVCSRRNVPETIGTDVEIDDRGRVTVVSEKGLLG